MPWAFRLRLPRIRRAAPDLHSHRAWPTACCFFSGLLRPQVVQVVSSVVPLHLSGVSSPSGWCWCALVVKWCPIMSWPSLTTNGTARGRVLRRRTFHPRPRRSAFIVEGHEVQVRQQCPGTPVLPGRDAHSVGEDLYIAYLVCRYLLSHNDVRTLPGPARPFVLRGLPCPPHLGPLAPVQNVLASRETKPALNPCSLPIAPFYQVYDARSMALSLFIATPPCS